MTLYGRRSTLGLVGEEIDVETGEWKSRQSHVGGGIDSYYEYLLKCARLFGDKECDTMWRDSVRALNTRLADDTRKGLWYGQVDMETGRRTASEFGALHAFLPGVLALSGDLGRRPPPPGVVLQDVDPSRHRARGPRLPGDEGPRRGLPAPARDHRVGVHLHRVTKDRRYLEMGRTFFESLVKHCRTERGYTTLKSVVTKEKGDLMPSYFLAETLKYLYLLFAPDETLDFGTVVFNTEAHPLKRTW